MGERLTPERLEDIRACLARGRFPTLGTGLDAVDDLLGHIDALTEELARKCAALHDADGSTAAAKEETDGSE